MGTPAFEELEVYRLAEVLADDIWRTALAWNSFAGATIGTQVVRSADSIGANIAEGYGRAAMKDNCRFIRIARGSLNETIHWMRRAYCRGLLTEAETVQLKSRFDELAPRLNAYLRSVGTPKAPGRTGEVRHTKYKLQNTTDK
jgi:four helix bundle protein